ncbi:NAD(P)H-hydrate dehydratase [Aureitalea marina]|uniref:Bifunctional NAD(P)H-hydrate repair enzyme n=1 Tax=Aureitalea marina TaxID=930804 RepID=A0A2S7KNY2_9FLAO|nr:NAD(P)H-hydrate dehydratase [Aureitalea marina]PQB04317.1 carbohydrate kinase [Aureitalea marina]
MKIFSAEQLYEADRITCEKQQISSTDLMERAAGQIFNWLNTRMQGAQVPIHIFCGIGNNGGDGLALGRMLINHGYKVEVYIANFTDKRSKCFLINYGRIKDVTKNWPKLMSGPDDFPEIHPDDIIVDALFGIGLTRAIEGWVKELVLHLNSSPAFKLAIDIPSGLSANGPVLDPEGVVRANHTLTFQTPKMAFFLPKSGQFVPYFEALDIGLDPQYLIETKPMASIVLKPEVKSFYRQRNKYSHKGDYGHLLMAGGNQGQMGAMVLSSQAALRTGCGLLTVHVPKCGLDILQTAVPEAMAQPDLEELTISDIPVNWSPTTVAVGMGMGTKAETAEAIKTLFAQTEQPMVIDADALNLISEHQNMFDSIPQGSILTPHPGELKRLVGEWTDDYDKIERVKQLCEKHQLIILVKGANTLVIGPGLIKINSTGNPGMATAGSGDVLSGMIGSLLAQGYEPIIAAIMGVYLHGSAGNMAATELGFEAVTASEISSRISESFLELFREEAPPQNSGSKE